MFHILVADDDKNTRRLFQALLEAENYTVHTACTGRQALDVIYQTHIDLAVVDLMMPDMDGYELIESLRQAGNNLPILMISARHMPSDKKQAFRLGVDDYMVKPVDGEEMILRIQALLRRSQLESVHVLQAGKVMLDYDALSVSKEGEKMCLPQKEFMLLYKLLSNPGKIFTRLSLLEEIWGDDKDTGPESVTVHIGRLRKRFASWNEFKIESVRGLGYKAVLSDEA
jgi:DNA-binding response OmpR family regulator